jgi:hypothetical protein
MDEKIGSLSGEIWQYLSTNGPVTVLKLKSCLAVPNSLLFLALGWLAREGKIKITQTEPVLTVALKQ